MIGHEPLGCTDGYGFVDVFTTAAGLTEGRANAAANQGEGILSPVDFQRFCVPSLGHQCHVAGYVNVGRAGIGAPGSNQSRASPCGTSLVHDVSNELILEVAKR